jgi:hypothetical protein
VTAAVMCRLWHRTRLGMAGQLSKEGGKEKQVRLLRCSEYLIARELKECYVSLAGSRPEPVLRQPLSCGLVPFHPFDHGPSRVVAHAGHPPAARACAHG